ncbi:MAG: GNAT family N-acetyltransferase [Chloroflexota bacterium]
MRPIETGRLVIRPFKGDDWHDFFSYTSRPEVWELLPSEPYTRQEAKRYVDDAASAVERTGLLTEMAVALKSTDRLVGHVSFRVYNATYRTREIGWVISPAFQNHGYATEAASALLRYGFESLNLHRVVATCDTRNAASYRVMEKLGMRCEAHFHKNTLIRGEWFDEFFYAILEEEWKLWSRGPA